MKLNEHKLIKIYLATFLFLFVIITIIDTNYYPKIEDISNINKNFNNKKIGVHAKIIDIENKGNITILTLENMGDGIKISVETELENIDGVVFNMNTLDLKEIRKYFKNDDYLYFFGKITLYQGEIQFIIEEIKKDL